MEENAVTPTRDWKTEMKTRINSNAINPQKINNAEKGETYTKI